MQVRLKHLCEALVDQGKVVHGQEVGYACARPAAYEIPRYGGLSVLLCEKCAVIQKETPFRLTLRPSSWDRRKAQVAMAMKLGEPN